MIQLLSRFGERTRRRLRDADKLDAGCKPALTPTCAVMDSGISGVQNLESINMSNKGNKNLRVANPQGLKRILFFLSAFIISLQAFSVTLSYTGSYPENNSSVASLDELTLLFDIASENSLESEEWGICRNAFYNAKLPTRTKAAELYEGDKETGTCIARDANTVVPTSDLMLVGNNAVFNFSNAVIKPNQKYTVIITNEFYAGKKGESSWDTSSKLSFYEEPLVLTFYGSSEALLVDSYTPDSSTPIDEISTVSIKFNANIGLVDNLQSIDILGDGGVISSSSEISVDAVDGALVTIQFPLTKLYKNEEYTITIPASSFYNLDNEDIVNDQLTLTFSGNSWRHFELGRGLYPSNNETVIEIDNIFIPFKFPDGYGFKASSSGPASYIAYVYKGSQNEDLVYTISLEPSTSGNALEGTIDADLDAGVAYTIVIPEGQLTIRNLNGVGALEGWTNGEIVINLTTPAEEAINKVELQGSIPTSGKHLEEFKMTLMPYTYDSTSYATVLAENAAIILYENEEEVAKFPVEIATVDNSSALRNKEPMNTVLATGKNYKVVLPAGTVAPDHAFLGKYGANKEMSFVVEGKMPATVELSYVISEGASMKTTLSGGSKATFKAEAPENWVVESVNFNGEPMEAVNGEYTTPAIEDDATVTVVYAFDGEIQFVDLSTGVEDVTIGDSDYTVGKDGVYVVIKGLTSGDNVTIYTVNGQVVGQHTANLDTLKIELPAGIYIIRVNNVTFKIQH